MIRESMSRLPFSEAVQSIARFALIRLVDACEHLANDKGEFDYDKAIHLLKGPVIEIGGPTYNYPVIHNSVPHLPLVTNYDKYTLGIHVVADARHLPFQDRSVGMVLASNLPMTVTGCEYRESLRDYTNRAKGEYRTYSSDNEIAPVDGRANLRITAIEEATRVLEPRGLLVWQGGFEEDIGIAEANGLKLVMVQTEDTGYTTYDCVFQKA